MFVISTVYEPSLLILGELMLQKKARAFALAKFFQLSLIILGEMTLLLQKARVFALVEFFTQSNNLRGYDPVAKRQSICPCQVFSA